MEFTDWLRAAAALAATLAILGLGAYAARRFGAFLPQGAQTRRLKVVERLALDPRRQLVLVALDGEEHLLLLSPFGDRPVAARAAAVASADEPEVAP